MTRRTAPPSADPLQAPPVADTWPAVPPLVPPVMTAVAFDAFGPPDVLRPRELATPRPGPGEVLVRVGAVSVGRLLDLGARSGRHPFAGFRMPHVLGAEHAGTVVALGEGASGALRVGDHVAVFPVVTCGTCPACRAGHSEGCAHLAILGVHRPGAYAEYCAVPADNVTLVPSGVGPAEAAALALAGPVAMNQFTQADLASGDWVLVQGAASALGSLTVALALHLGAQVVATSRSAAKRAVLLEMGATAALDPTSPDFADDVLALTEGRGVRLAVDDLGDPAIFAATMRTLAVLGTVVSSGAFLGGKVELDLMSLYLRSQRVVGVRTGTLESARALWTAVAQGFRPVLDRSFPLVDAARAHEYLEDDGNLGRVVLTTGPDRTEAGA